MEVKPPLKLYQDTYLSTSIFCETFKFRFGAESARIHITSAYYPIFCRIFFDILRINITMWNVIGWLWHYARNLMGFDKGQLEGNECEEAEQASNVCSYVRIAICTCTWSICEYYYCLLLYSSEVKYYMMRSCILINMVKWQERIISRNTSPYSHVHSHESFKSRWDAKLCKLRCIRKNGKQWREDNSERRSFPKVILMLLRNQTSEFEWVCSQRVYGNRILLSLKVN